MARALRVILTPLSGSQAGSVVGARLAIQRLGAGSSSAKRGAPSPATLTFIASCFAQAQKPERREREIGFLNGALELSEADGRPTFRVSPTDNQALFGEGPPPSGSGSKPRALRLEFSAATFRLPLELATSVARLFVPADLSEGTRHLELFVELRIAGTVEAPRDANDVLDVPLVPRPFHRVRIVDELGEPIPDVPGQFEGPDFSESVTSDAEGRCTIDDLGLEGMTFRIEDDSGLRAALKERWNEPRVGAPLRASATTQVIAVKSALEPIETPAGSLNTLSIQPSVALARLVGLLFDTNKSFLLPSALTDMESLKALYDERPESGLLVVGHTDTSADPSVNDPLSVERAESVAAYLKDDVDVWLARYESSVPEKRRWGATEDTLMLQTLPDFFERPADEDPVRFFQRTRGLTEDGIAGPETRRALIREYMSRDETTLPAAISITVHGCGEFFPLTATGQDIESKPKNPDRDPVDRRVELYFFDEEFGIQPPPPGKNSKKDSREYPEWRKRAAILLENELRFSNRTLRLRFQAEGSPIANEEFSLDVDGRRLTVGRTDADGLVEQRLPVDAKIAQVRLPRLSLLRSVEIQAAETFPPVDVLLGMQVRLSQLGFLIEEPSGSFDEPTRDAIVAFRRVRGLSPEPLLDEATRRELKEAYGS